MNRKAMALNQSRQPAKVFLLSAIALFAVSAASAQEADQDFNKELDQETPPQQKQEAQKPDTKASAGKFFQIELAKEPSKSGRVIGPREFALAMIIVGLVSLVMATLEHRRESQSLGAQYSGIAPMSLARVLAALISFLGIIALIAVVFRQ